MDIVKALRAVAEKAIEVGLTDVAIEEVGATHEFADKYVCRASHRPGSQPDCCDSCSGGNALELVAMECWWLLTMVLVSSFARC